MDQPLLTDDQFLGDTSAPDTSASSSTGTPAAVPVTPWGWPQGSAPPDLSSATSDSEMPPLTITKKQPPIAQPPAQQSSLSGAPAVAPGAAPLTGSGTSGPPLLTDDEFLGPPPVESGKPLDNSGSENWFSGLAKGAASGAIEGLANSAGFVGNLSHFADYLLDRGESTFTGMPLEEVQAKNRALQQQSSQQHAQDMGVFNLPDLRQIMPSGQDLYPTGLGDYQPDSEWGRLAKAGVSTAFSMIGPGGGALSKGATVPQIMKTLVSTAPSNSVAGGVGQGATDITGDPLIGMGAGMIGGGLTTGAASLARPIVASPERLAGEQLMQAARNPWAYKSALQNNPETIVPGSVPTTGQLTGDIGILQAERQARTADNSDFNIREGDQNSAQQRALESQAPANADMMAAPQYFQRTIDGIDSASEYAVDQMQQRAQQEAASLGPGPSADDIGARLRNAVEDIRGVQKQAKNSLYDAVDPDGSLNLVATPIKQGASQISSEVGPQATPMTPDEQRIHAQVAALPDVAKFKNIRDLDQNLSKAMSDERRTGESPAWRRLVQLKGHVKNAINNAVANQVAYERQAVARGELPPDQTAEARLRSMWGLNDAGAASYHARQSAQGTGTGTFGLSRNGTPGSVSSNRAGRETAWGGYPVDQAPGHSGISAASLTPNLDPAAAQRLATANQAYANYAQTYRNGPIAPVLRTNGFAGQYQTSAASVPGKAFVKGANGYSTVKAFLKAGAGHPDTIPAMQDAALEPLRKGLKQDGTLDPAKLTAWKNDYGPSLKAIDEVSPGFSSQFTNAAKASDLLVRAGRLRQDALDQYQKTAAGKFLGKTNPTEVQNEVLGILSDKRNGPTRMRQLFQQASNDPAALDGLRKAGIDGILSRFKTGAQVGQQGEPLLASAGLRKFINDNHGALSQLYPVDVVNNMKAVAADLERAEKSVSATRIKGSPGSAKDILPFMKKAAEAATHGGNMYTLALMGGLEAYREFGLPAAVATAVAAPVMHGLNALRAAKLEKVNELFRDALLNPERARIYAQKYGTVPPHGPWYALSRTVRRGYSLSPETVQNKEEGAPGFARGGKVGGQSWLSGGPFFSGPFLASGGRVSMDAAVPETRETLAAQQKELIDGKQALMIFKGSVHKLPRPAGMGEFRLGDDVVQYNPAKISSDGIRLAAENDTLGRLLRLGPVTKNEALARAQHGERPVAVVERSPNGTEIRAALGTHMTAPDQIRHFENTRTNSANHIGLESPSSVVGQRLEGRAAGGRVVADKNPTEAEKTAGNYRKGHMRLHGLDITIENPKGSFRTGVGKDGKPWKVRIPNHYGYIRGTTGADGDHVDCYVGPDEASERVFVIDQKDPDADKFDESKIMLGFKNREAAIGGYQKGFSDGSGVRRMMKITPMTIDELKRWLRYGNATLPASQAA